MNILLVYPNFRYTASGGYVPLGLLYIAAVARKYGHKVSLIDMTFQDEPRFSEHQLKDIDAVGISFSTPLAGKAYEAIKCIKSTRPELTCIAGGPHPTVCPEECLRKGFDIVVLGEGEYTIVDLLEKMESSCSLHEVNGIAFLEKNEVIFTVPRALIENLDDLPFPARDLINWDAYSKINDTITIFTSRGCPYHCLFCKPMQEKLFGKRVRRRTPSNVLDEIEKIIRDIKRADYVFTFIDDTFLFSKEWIVSFCNEIKNRNLKLRWTCQARVDNIDEELLETIKKGGCFWLSMGVESGSQKILDFLTKGIKVKDIIRAFDLCHKVGIGTYSYIIIGSPMETKQDLDATANLIKRIRPSCIAISRLTPTLGSDLYEFAVKHGLLNISSFEEYDYYANAYPINLEYLSKSDLDRYGHIMRRIALRINLWRNITNPSYLEKVVFEVFNRPKSIIGKITNILRLFF